MLTEANFIKIIILSLIGIWGGISFIRKLLTNDFLKPYTFDETGFTNENHYYDKDSKLQNSLFEETSQAKKVLSHIKDQSVQASKDSKELIEEEPKRYTTQKSTEQHKIEHLLSIGPLCDPFISTDTFNKLQEMLSVEQTRLIAITQLGGMGKTQLARHAAQYQYEAYKTDCNLSNKPILICELNSNNFYNLINSFKELVRKLKVKYELSFQDFEIKSSEDLKIFCEQIYEKIESKFIQSILIFDNTPRYKKDEQEDLFGIGEYLPSTSISNIKSIITSQREDFFSNSSQYRSLVLDKNYFKTAASKLIEVLDSELIFDKNKDTLLERLDYLPLAINLIGHYTKQTKQSAQDILNRLNKNSEYLNNPKFLRLTENNPFYDKTIYAALALPLETIINNKIYSDAWELLVFASLITSNDIDIILFKSYLKLKYPSASTDEIEYKLDTALNVFKNYSLVQFSNLKESYSVHRLLQDVVRNEYTSSNSLSFNSTLPEVIKRCLNSLLSSIDEIVNNNLNVSEHLPIIEHANIFSNHILTLYNKTEDLELADLFHQLGYVLLNFEGRKSIVQAQIYLRRAVIIRKKHLGENHLYVAKSYNNLAETHRILAIKYVNQDSRLNLKKACRYNLKALNIRIEKLGIYHTEVATSYNNLAETFRNMAELMPSADKPRMLKEALEYQKSALLIRKQCLNLRDQLVATDYNNLALSYAGLGDTYNLIQAIIYHYIALDIFEDYKIQAISNFALAHSNTGRALSDLSANIIPNEIDKFSAIIDANIFLEYPQAKLHFNQLINAINDSESKFILKAAAYHICQAILIWKNIQNFKSHSLALSLYNLGNVKEALGNEAEMTKAITYYCNAKLLWSNELDKNYDINTVNNRLMSLTKKLEKLNLLKLLDKAVCDNLNINNSNLDSLIEEDCMKKNAFNYQVKNNDNSHRGNTKPLAGYSSWDERHDSYVFPRNIPLNNRHNKSLYSFKLNTYPLTIEQISSKVYFENISNSIQSLLITFQKKSKHSLPNNTQSLRLLYEIGKWDEKISLQGNTQKPIFVFRVYSRGREVGYAKFYQHPFLCRNLEADQHNLIELTGVLKQLNLDSNLKLDWIEEICVSLPPTLKQQIQTSAYHSIKHGCLRAVSNVVGYTLQRKGYSKYVSKTASQVIYYGSYFAQNYNYILAKNPVEHENLVSHTIVAQQALWNTSVLFFSNQVINQTSKLIFHTGNKLQQKGWNKIGILFNGLGRYGYAATYVVNSICHRELLPSITSLISGTLTEYAIIKAGETIVDNILPDQQPTTKL